MRCDQCEFSIKFPHGYVCRRFPPVVLLVPKSLPDAMGRMVPGMGMESTLPAVEAEFWCGEYKPAKSIVVANGIGALN